MMNDELEKATETIRTLEATLKTTEEKYRLLLDNVRAGVSVHQELPDGRGLIERESAEEELRATEERYKTLTDILNIGVYRNTPGPEGKFIEMNSAHVRMFGYKSKSELLGVKVVDLYQCPEDRQRFSERLSRVGFAHEEVQLKKKDGTPIVCSVSAMAVKNEEEEVMYFEGVIEDITDYKQTEAALQESQERYLLQVEHSYDAISRLNKDGVFLELNTIAARKMGRKLDDLIGKSLYDVFPKEVASEHISSIRQVISSREGHTSESLVPLPTGDRWISATVQPIPEPDGSILSVQVISHDTTEEKQAQVREKQAYVQGRLEILDTILHNIGNDLNSVTIGIGTVQNLLTGKLTNYLSSLANAIQEHQDDFSDYVKNDPQGQKIVPFIIALAEDFKRRDAELTKTVGRVSERAQSVAEVIGTAFKESRQPRKDVDLRKAVDNAVTVLQDSIKERDVEVIIDCDNAPEVISIQESQLHQMLVNLIKNSIEAIEDLRMSGSLSETSFLFCSVQATHQEELNNGVISEGLRQEFSHHRILLSDNISVLTEELETRWLIVDHDKTYMVRKKADMLNIHTAFVKITCYSESGSLILEVTDNGIGIEEDKLKEIIFRSEYTTKDSGTGTGLHSIKKFIKTCDGEIKATSNGIGKGATMQVMLPLEHRPTM